MGCERGALCHKLQRNGWSFIQRLVYQLTNILPPAGIAEFNPTPFSKSLLLRTFPIIAPVSFVHVHKTMQNWPPIGHRAGRSQVWNGRWWRKSRRSKRYLSCPRLFDSYLKGAVPTRKPRISRNYLREISVMSTIVVGIKSFRPNDAIKSHRGKNQTRNEDVWKSTSGGGRRAPTISAVSVDDGEPHPRIPR